MVGIYVQHNLNAFLYTGRANPKVFQKEKKKIPFFPQLYAY